MVARRDRGRQSGDARADDHDVGRVVPADLRLRVGLLPARPGNRDGAGRASRNKRSPADVGRSATCCASLRVLGHSHPSPGF